MTTTALRAATARWARRRRQAIAAGTWQPWADAAPARAHVMDLRATGMSLAALADRTGVTLATLDYLLYGKDSYGPAAKIRTESAAALLAYHPTLDDYPDGAIIDATGSRRRLRALATIGWPMSEVTRRIGGYNPATFELISQGSRTRVTAATAREIRTFYQRAATDRAEAHGVTVWVAKRARRRAAEQGWPDPVFWDDYENRIDDPDFDPAAAEASAPSRGAVLAEDGRWLEAQGYTRGQAAERLGVTKNTLQKAMERYPASPEEAAA